MAQLYISQRRLDSWTAENRIEVTGDTMMLVELKRSFAIRPAVRFLQVVGGDEDPHDLVGRVKEETELESMGADHMATSVIYGEIAYEVEMGFVGAPLPRGGARG